ncbi:Cht5 [Cordylochernes scorpioides]|uniref:Cht5 n=1 Tax=Cordylochernes scorpioides TaxID=51811 RepID=A0ABY6JY74_9ARAC|nr:Cht5 [Cordylochernes scorpioides]
MFQMDYIRDHRYGGAMIWAIDMDDFTGICGEKNGLLKVMNKRLEGYEVPLPDPSQETTPAGTTAKTWWPRWTSPTSRPITEAVTRRTSTQRPPFTTPSTPRPPFTTPSTTTSRRPSTPDDSNDIPDSICSDPKTVFLPHPSDCHKFIWCVYGHPREMQCEGASVWNQEKKVCDWPYNMDEKHPCGPSLYGGRFPFPGFQ